MDQPNTIFLCEPEQLTLSTQYDALPGRVVVQMYEGKSRNGILMPLSGNLNPDMGVVVSSGVMDLMVGDEVGVKPYDGGWKDDLRFYGITDDWFDSIPIRRVGTEILPNWDWVIVERLDQSSTIITKQFSPLSRVVKAGPGKIKGGRRIEPQVSEGDIVACGDPYLRLRFGGESNWRLVREEDILFVCNGPQV